MEDPRFAAVFLFNRLHAIVDDALAGKKQVKKALLIRKLQRLCCRVDGAERAG